MRLHYLGGQALQTERSFATIRPMGPQCSICGHAKLAELHSRIQAESAKSLASELEMSLPAVYRHLKAGHLPKIAQEGPQRPAVAPNGSLPDNPAQNSLALPYAISATLRDVQRLAREAQRHLKDARKEGDHKATNGAITAAAKALELVGKLRGELQHGQAVNVTVSAEARVAMDLRSEAEGLAPGDTSEAAHAWLHAQIEAGDRDAVRIVLELVRMIPSAEVESQGVTGALVPNAGDVILIDNAKS